VNFQDGGSRHLGFSKSLNFNVRPLKGVNMHHLANFFNNGQTAAEM